MIYAKRAVARPPNGLIRYPRLACSGPTRGPDGCTLLVTALRIHIQVCHHNLAKAASAAAKAATDARAPWRGKGVVWECTCLGRMLALCSVRALVLSHHRVFVESCPCVCEHLRGGPAPLTLRRWCAQMHGTHGRLCDGAAALVRDERLEVDLLVPVDPLYLVQWQLRVRSCASSDAVPFA